MSKLQIYTRVGSDTVKVLKSNCIQDVYEEAAETYFAHDEWGLGLLYILEQYR